MVLLRLGLKKSIFGRTPVPVPLRIRLARRTGISLSTLPTVVLAGVALDDRTAGPVIGLHLAVAVPDLPLPLGLAVPGLRDVPNLGILALRCLGWLLTRTNE